jgi:hypothetical protein
MAVALPVRSSEQDDHINLWVIAESAVEQHGMGLAIAAANRLLQVQREHYGAEAMPKPESFPIDKIYVPVKRKKALKPDLVQEIAESMLEIGQQSPILVRPDEDRFVLVEGLHRFEACKALGEATIIGLLVSADIAQQSTPPFQSDEAKAESEKMARLKKLRLEKQAAEELAIASGAATATRSAESLRERPEKGSRGNPKAPSQSNRRLSEARPKTLSEWITQQKRDGERY